MTTKEAPHVICFQPGSGEEDILIKTKSAKTRFLILAGQPLNEPIANYGPFVLSTQEQLHQAFDDF